MDDLARLRLEAVGMVLPSGLEPLRHEAVAEGYQFIERLCVEWQSGAMRFDGPDERLLIAYQGHELAGIGGISNDPIVPGALRMRRFYIRPKMRGLGLGRMLVEELRRNLHSRTITVHAGTESAERFWDTMGFPRSDIAGITHLKAPAAR